MFSNLDKVAELLNEVAEQTILPRFQNLSEGEVSYKKGGETVTIADTEAESLLEKRLTDLFPGSQVIGEEKIADTPDLLENLDERELTWIIDPIDGTNNFARGRDIFKTMLALVYQGETVAGWILDPVHKSMLEARREEGAFLDGQRLNIAGSNKVLHQSVGTIHGSENQDPIIKKSLDKNRSKLNTVNTLRCAGADYERLAASKTQFALFTRLMPWDHLPGELIHKEAGGYGACLDRTAYNYSAYNKQGLLLAPNEEWWDEIHRKLFLD
ncbi:inositol monophosphatase [Kiloniella sp. EL199]|uniref:inositol monophosphatase family protein n=1 Tax=Kiloniella sp. EL199 TaxID=2107581 RepID=UPI000EA25208|nr:inositol monophosphatase [Kiloniella sp. EL199]